MTIPMGSIVLVGIARRKSECRGSTLGSALGAIVLLLMAGCGGIGSGGGGQPPQISVTVSPRVANVYAAEPGNTWPASATEQQFTAVVNNGSSQTVTWAVTGGRGNGSIDQNGLYSAPTAAPAGAVSVTGTSAETTSPGTANVNVETATAVGTYSNVQMSATAAGGAAHADSVTWWWTEVRVRSVTSVQFRYIQWVSGADSVRAFCLHVTVPAFDWGVGSGETLDFYCPDYELFSL